LCNSCRVVLLIVSLSLSLSCMYNQTVCDLCTLTPTFTLVLYYCLDRQTSFNLAANPAFNDPAITSARFPSPVLVPAMPEGYHNSSSMISPLQVAYGPPPGLTYPPGISSNPAAPGLTTPEIGENTTRFYNAAETAKKLGEILYPEAPTGLPDGVDLLVYLAFQNSHALVPISQDLLINGMTFLVEFLGQERGTRCLQQFLREARSHLSHCGWPSDMQMVCSTLSSCQLVACSNTTSCRARSLLGNYF
jgi:hypothetical protein